MAVVNLAQPDVTLLLDMGGVIREATVSSALSEDGVASWLGRSWDDTVPDMVGDKVRRIVEDARESGISAFRQITQRFPSGRELPIEYTTVLLGGRAGMLAVGKSLHAVAELQTRLIAAQQAMERDYWKLREVETRYRLLFNSSSEAVLLVKAANFRVVEANPSAIEALGLSGLGADGAVGHDILSVIPPDERSALTAMLRRVKEQGKAPGSLVHLGEGRLPWLVRASLMKADPEPLILLQLVATGGVRPVPRAEATPVPDDMVNGLPDGFVTLDRDGMVLRANRAFADLVEMGTVESVLGNRLDRWLTRPGADLSALLSMLRSHGVVRLFTTGLHGELGSDAEVEISAAGFPEADPQFYGVLLRDVGRRLVPAGEPALVNGFRDSIVEPVGRMPLRQLIKATVDGVERHYVKAALERSGGNRTAASELLGLSRQSLYMKLSRYGLDQDERADRVEEE